MHDLASPETFSCGVTGSRFIQPGVLCNSEMTLVVERVTDHRPLLRILDKIQSNRLVLRELDVLTGKSRLQDVPSPQPVLFDGTRLARTFGPQWHLLLIGANDLAAYIADIAPALGFALTICEPRDVYRDSWSEHGLTLTNAMPDDLIASLVVDDRHAIVALSHDPKLDDMALMAALQSPAFYVGAVGSRRTSASRRRRLRQLGLGAEAVARLRGPVGVPIGSRTPPEIAISILAEIIAARGAKVQGQHAEAEASAIHAGI
jgi:xanthine dehydrogenase accessory factor